MLSPLVDIRIWKLGEYSLGQSGCCGRYTVGLMYHILIVAEQHVSMYMLYCHAELHHEFSK